MSARDMEPIIITVSDPTTELHASAEVTMFHDEALKLTAYSVRLGDKCSPAMSLREVGAVLKGLDARVLR